jgi:hypothetical protein
MCVALTILVVAAAAAAAVQRSVLPRGGPISHQLLAAGRESLTCIQEREAGADACCCSGILLRSHPGRC